MHVQSYLIAVLLIVLLATLANGADYYVNGTTGDDTSSCEDPTMPCKTIKRALTLFSTTPGTGSIRVSAGSYTEEDLPLPSELSFKNEFTIDGGWNADFSSQTCDPAATVLIPGFTANPGYHILFHAWVDNTDAAAFTLRCMTLQKTAFGDMTGAINIQALHQGQAQFIMEHVRVTGFTTTAISLSSHDSSQLDATFKDITVDHNLEANDGSAIAISASGSGTPLTTVTIENSSILANGFAGGNVRALYLYAMGTGRLDGKVENCILAENSGMYGSAFSIFSTDLGSSLNLSLINSTVVDNNVGDLSYNAGFGADSRMDAEISISMRNTILTGNHHLEVQKDLYLTETNATPNGQIVFSGDYNILGEYGQSGTPSYTSDHALHVDPLLDDSYHLRRGSPAIDGGQCGYLASGYTRVAPLTDIDGDPRPETGTILGCDIGADEFLRPFPWPLFVPSVNPQSSFSE